MSIGIVGYGKLCDSTAVLVVIYEDGDVPTAAIVELDLSQLRQRP